MHEDRQICILIPLFYVETCFCFIWLNAWRWLRQFFFFKLSTNTWLNIVCFLRKWVIDSPHKIKWQNLHQFWIVKFTSEPPSPNKSVMFSKFNSNLNQDANFFIFFIIKPWVFIGYPNSIPRQRMDEMNIYLRNLILFKLGRLDKVRNPLISQTTWWFYKPYWLQKKKMKRKR